jgi:hypothetical protein
VARPLYGGSRVPRSEAVADDLDPPRAPMRPDSPQRNDRPPLSFGAGQCSSLRPARRPPLRAAHCRSFRAADSSSFRAGHFPSFRAGQRSSFRADLPSSFRADHFSSFRADHFSSFRAEGEESPVHRVAEIPRCARDDKVGRCARNRGGNDGQCARTRDEALSLRGGSSLPSRARRASSFRADLPSSFRADHFSSFRAVGEESPVHRAAEIPRFARDDKVGCCPRIRAANDGQCARTRDEALSLRGGSSLPSRAHRASSVRATRRPSFRVEGEESPVHRAAEIPRCARDDKVGRCAGTRRDRAGAGARRGVDDAAPRAQTRDDSDRRQAAAQSRQTRRAGARTRETSR